MRSSWLGRLLAGVALVTVLGTCTFAQSGTTDEAKRKVKSKVAPVYPELARRMNVTGKVKVEVIVAPDGHVKSTRAIGGHPLLVQPCLEAVKEWRFAAAAEESTQVVEFEFTASN